MNAGQKKQGEVWVNKVTSEGDVELLRRVRAHLILRGTHLKGWAREHKLPFASVRLAILHGAKGTRLRRIAAIRSLVLRDTVENASEKLEGANKAL